MKETKNPPLHLKKPTTHVVVKQVAVKIGANEQANVGPETSKQVVAKINSNEQAAVEKKLVNEPSDNVIKGLKKATHPSGHFHQETSGLDPIPDRVTKRPDTSDSLFSMRLFNSDKDLPFVYTDDYNMSAIGIELLHRFDTKKYGKIAQYLSDAFLDTPFPKHKEPENQTNDEHKSVRRLHYLRPNRPVSRRELEIHHSANFITRIHEEKSLVARITEVWALNLMPSGSIESRLLIPLRWQVAGTIFATYLAMQHGWAINLDIFIAMKHIWRKHPLQKFMIIDLDAHQGVGVESDIVELDPKRRQMVFMVDIFNTAIQPPNERADKGIDVRVELGKFTGDETYLKRLREALTTAFERFKPTMVIYVAGQDVLREDQLGLMNLSAAGLRERDELVFSSATERGCPIVMLLGGGYLNRGAKIQVDSIRSLFAKGLIWGGHRSGLRSLSRPRRASGLTGVSSKIDATIKKSTVSHSSTKTTPKHNLIKATPVETKFLLKKTFDQPTKDDKSQK